MSFNLFLMVFRPPDNRIDHSWISKNLGLTGQWGQQIYQSILNWISQEHSIIKSGKTSRKNYIIKLKQSAFAQWSQDLAPYYPNSELTPTLFAKHVYLFAVIDTFLSVIAQNFYFSIQKFLSIPSYYQEVRDNSKISPKLKELEKFLGTAKLQPEDLFADLYQDVLGDSTRYNQGEFYTHEYLCKIMVDQSYNIGDKVLDPTCGSGSFLIAIANKILTISLPLEEKLFALKNIYGVDRNPLACLMSQTNLQNLLKYYHISPFLFPIFQKNGLEMRPSDLNYAIDGNNNAENSDLWDLIIGNPPWLVLNGVPSQAEKEKIKKLGKQLKIVRGGKYATSTEITTIFWQKMVNEFLKPNGLIHFVVPAGIATGDQHALFRRFLGVKEVEIWDFDYDFFRIHSICLKARKSSRNEKTDDDYNSEESLFGGKNHTYPVVNWNKFHWDSKKAHLRFVKMEEYLPIVIDEDSELMVGRLTPKILLKSELGLNEPLLLSKTRQSPYRELFRQGASLVPRNLIFVDIHEMKSEMKSEMKNEKKTENKNEKKTVKITENHNENHETGELVEICPAENLISKKDSTWNFKAYEKRQIESKYIFPAAKSTGLLSFYYFEFYHTVLPLEINTEPQNSLQSSLSNYLKNHRVEKPHISTTASVTLPSAPYARKHFQELINIYNHNTKSGAQITHFFDRLNYGRALTDPKQFQIPKVIFAGIGSNVKAAVLHQSAIIDTSLYFYVPNSYEEAYYLTGILNSSFITSFVRMAGSTGANGSLRNIHKTPLKLPIPIYSEKNEIHRKISTLARETEIYTVKFVEQAVIENPSLKERVKTLQNKLLGDSTYRQKITQITSLVKKLIGFG